MKKIFKRFSPNPHHLKQHKHIGWLGKHLHDVSLWNFNRKSIAKAFAVGLFCAFVPIPFQMVLAAIAAVFFSANLPLSVALVWISNPLTIPPIFYAIYKLGAWILGVSIDSSFAMSWDYITHSLGTILPPLLLGSLIVSTISAFLGYGSIQLIYRLKAHRRSGMFKKSATTRQQKK